VEYILVNSKNFKFCAEEILQSTRISLDFETSGLVQRQDYIVGCSIGNGIKAWYIPVRHLCNNVQVYNLYLLLNQINRSDIKIVFHNGKFDWKLAYLEGIDLRINDDTILMISQIDGGLKTELESLIYHYFKIKKKNFIQTFGKDANLAYKAPEDVYNYACGDAEYTLKLYAKLQSLMTLKMNGKYKVEMDLIKPIAKIELQGLKVDKKELDKLKKKNEKEMGELYSRVIHEISSKISDENVEINLNSPEQIATILNSLYKVPLKSLKLSEKTGKYTADNKILQRISIPICSDIIGWKSKSKETGMYVNGWTPKIIPCNSKIYTSIRQTQAATGRMASSEPNMQQVKKSVRNIIVPMDGFYFLSADYSQIEAKILLALAKSPAVKMINDGMDLHKVVGSLIFGKRPEDVTEKERAASKTVTYGTIYMQSAWALAKQLNISEIEAKELQDNFYDFTQTREYISNAMEEIRLNGYSETYGGKRRFFPNINLVNKYLRGAAERSAFNTIFQGTAGEIFKKGFLNTYNYINANWGMDSIKILLPIHDELLFEIANEIDVNSIAPQLQNQMETEFEGMFITTEAKWGYNWRDMEEIK